MFASPYCWAVSISYTNHLKCIWSRKTTVADPVMVLPKELLILNLLTVPLPISWCLTCIIRSAAFLSLFIGQWRRSVIAYSVLQGILRRWESTKPAGGRTACPAGKGVQRAAAPAGSTSYPHSLCRPCSTPRSALKGDKEWKRKN